MLPSTSPIRRGALYIKTLMCVLPRWEQQSVVPQGTRVTLHHGLKRTNSGPTSCIPIGWQAISYTRRQDRRH